MDRTEVVTITNMCMVYDGDKVLVQEKIDDDYCGVTFPGGHVEKGESFTDAVIREVFEETGLRISSPALCGIKIGQMMMVQDIWFYFIKLTNLRGNCLHLMRVKFIGQK